MPVPVLLRTQSDARRALLAFGAERRGLSTEVLDRADLRVRIPMRSGVSSLNLATSVAAVLYGAGFATEPSGASGGVSGAER
jgi:tRNA G18 (ribose-2'-O)-methylase SpoU